MGHIARLLAVLSLVVAGPLLAQADTDAPRASEPYVYQVDSINPGLPAAGGEPFELDTPMATLESFLEAGGEEDWQRAAGAMDFANLSSAQQAQDGPELARQLYELVHRSIAIDWRDLPDRPDAMDTLSSDKNPMAGVERRNLLLGRLDLDGRSVPLRIARLQVEGNDPVWMFTRQTVGNVEPLYELYGPTRFERSLPDALRKQAFWTLAWWEVIALPLVLLLALLAGALTYRALQRLRDTCDPDTKVGGIARSVQLPATLLAVAGTFPFIRSVAFTFSGTVTEVLDPLQVLLIAVAVGAVILAAIEALLDLAISRNVDKLEDPDNEDSRDFYTRMSAIRRIIVVMVMLAGLGFVLVQTDLTSTLGFSLVASAGVIGLVIAFAAREVLGDIMASTQIAFAKTARIGDAVQYEGEWCYVEKIGFTHLRLRTWDDRRIMAPVGEFVGSSFENWTKEDPAIIERVPLHLDHRADVPALREVFMQFIAEDEDVIREDEATFEVIDHMATGMVARCCAYAEDPKKGWAMHCRLREHMLAAAARLDAGAANEPGPAFLPREREVRMDVSQGAE